MLSNAYPITAVADELFVDGAAREKFRYAQARQDAARLALSGTSRLHPFKRHALESTIALEASLAGEVVRMSEVNLAYAGIALADELMRAEDIDSRLSLGPPSAVNETYFPVFIESL